MQIHSTGILHKGDSGYSVIHHATDLVTGVHVKNAERIGYPPQIPTSAERYLTEMLLTVDVFPAVNPSSYQKLPDGSGAPS